MPIRRREAGAPRQPMSAEARAALDVERNRRGVQSRRPGGDTQKRTPSRKGRSGLSDAARASLQVEADRRRVGGTSKEDLARQSLQVEKDRRAKSARKKFKRFQKKKKGEKYSNDELAAEYGISKKKKKINYKKLQQAWERYATEESDGKVMYLDDFSQAIGKMGVNWDDDKIEEKFHSLDKNDDGVLEWEELVKVMGRARE